MHVYLHINTYIQTHTPTPHTHPTHTPHTHTHSTPPHSSPHARARAQRKEKSNMMILDILWELPMTTVPMLPEWRDTTPFAMLSLVTQPSGIVGQERSHLAVNLTSFSGKKQEISLPPSSLSQGSMQHQAGD